jgi:hypothetical protein
MWEVLLHKLLVPQMFKKFSSFYGSGSYVSVNNLMLILNVYVSEQFCYLQGCTSR